ncbi:MAG TPA: hypothetical protein VGC05_12310 [Mycobacterium sp.]
MTPPAGYARLRYLEDALAPDIVPTVDVINASNAMALSVGTGSDANALPSFMETFLRVKDKANLVVEHQVGDKVKNLYLQVNANGSVWHVNARIPIQRLQMGWSPSGFVHAGSAVRRWRSLFHSPTFGMIGMFGHGIVPGGH